jgi:2-hydroxychromene-2-carboxylate isomerase
MNEIEYFYAAHSAFAYLGSARLTEIARASGRTLTHRPFDLRRVMDEVAAAPFRSRSEAHLAYYFGREIDRWAEYRNAPCVGHTPTHHRNDYTLANCMLVAGAAQGLCVDALAHAMLQAHWRDDADLADRPTLVDITRSAGFDAEALMTAAELADARASYEANTQEAIRRSVFGSPTYFVDGDMFYGQDRLEMVERALQTPFAGTWPPD